MYLLCCLFISLFKGKFTFKSKPIAQPTDAMAGDNYDHGYNQENRYQVKTMSQHIKM